MFGELESDRDNNRKTKDNWNLKETGDLVWNTWTGLRFPLVLGVVASTEMKVEYNSGAIAR